MKKLLITIICVSFVGICVAFFNVFWKSELIDDILDILEPTGILVGVIAFLAQQLSEQRSQNTEFFIELKNNFITNESFMATFDQLYLQYKEKPSEIILCEVVKYLAYFDSIAIAHQNKLLTLEEISRTFSYYFFLAVNNKQVQSIALLPNAVYYPRIYELYDLLYKYEKDHNREILLEENSLHNTVAYQSILELYNKG